MQRASPAQADTKHLRSDWEKNAWITGAHAYKIDQSCKATIGPKRNRDNTTGGLSQTDPSDESLTTFSLVTEAVALNIVSAFVKSNRAATLPHKWQSLLWQLLRPRWVRHRASSADVEPSRREGERSGAVVDEAQILK